MGWFAIVEAKVLGPDLVQDALGKVKLIKGRLLATQDRQKAYVDHRWRDLEFSVGNMVFLKVSPMKGTLRFGQKGKLNPRYIGPYEVLERVGRWLIDWRRLRTSMGCIRYFMCRCCGSISMILPTCCNLKNCNLTAPFHMKKY